MSFRSIRSMVFALLVIAAGAGALDAASGHLHSSRVFGGGRLHSSFRGGNGRVFFWGPGWWGPGWWWGWGNPYLYGYADPNGYGARTSWTRVKTDVAPDEAALYLDGRLIGTADDFDGWPDVLYLAPGAYHLEFRLEGFENFDLDLDAKPGAFFRIDQKMKKIPGAKHYGTYKPARPSGGVIRYFGKRNGEDQPEPSDSTDASAGSDAQARIVFQISPDDSVVYLDDRFAGSARDLNRMSNGIAVSPGRHRVTVTRPGFSDQTVAIEALEGSKSSAIVSLAAAAEAP